MPDVTDQLDVVVSEDTPSRCDDLLSRAESGERLETDNRRDVIKYLMAVQPHLTNSEMARKFGVSEGMIRKDKDKIRRDIADDISNEDVGLVIGDIKRAHERFRTDILRVLNDKKLCPPGTANWLNHQKALVDYELKMVSAMQDLGVLPKNLGTMQQNKFVFKSHVAKDGSIETKAFDSTKEPKVIEGKVITKSQTLLAPVDEEDELLRNALRDEFSETPHEARLNKDPDDYESDGS